MSAISNFWNFQFWSCDLCLHVFLLHPSIFHVNRAIWCRDMAEKRFSRWRPSAILWFEILILVKWLLSESKFASAYQIASKLVNCSWDIVVSPFSKWRPSATLNFRNLPFLSRDLCLCAILFPHSKFCINRTIWCYDIAKNDFQYGVRLPAWIFEIWPFSESKLHHDTKFHGNQMNCSNGPFNGKIGNGTSRDLMIGVIRNHIFGIGEPICLFTIQISWGFYDD